jgi:hypothetical protein
MIVSSKTNGNIEDFKGLLNNLINKLNETPVEEVSNHAGTKFEPYVYDKLVNLAKGTAFEDTIELVAGQKFPDIIANKLFGLEIKTTTQNHWKTTGNSVFESTRVDGIDKIFLLFAKLASPVEFKYRPYEEVLSEIVVTHSPRYLIDMNLEEGNTIFDKIKVKYDILRVDPKPISPIIEYYRTKLKPGEELWWMDSQNNDKANNIILRIWNNLQPKEQNELKLKGMVYFPELFGNKQDKFNRFSIWLVQHESIICPNVRDLFTSGGQKTYTLNSITYPNTPAILFRLFSDFEKILSVLNDTPVSDLEKYWDCGTLHDVNRLDKWINLVSKNTNNNSIPTTSILENLKIKLNLKQK